MSRPILEVSGLTMRFGGLLAVNNVALTVQPKQVVSMIGPNGAGKTTVFNCLTGFYQPTGGVILLDDEPIHNLPGHKIAQKGVVRTFQNVRLFKEMTAVENLLVAQHRHLNTNFLAGLLKTPDFRRSEKAAMEYAAHWLEQVNLTDVANRPGRHPGLRPAAPSGNRPLHDDPSAYPDARRACSRPEPQGNRGPQGPDRHAA